MTGSDSSSRSLMAASSSNALCEVDSAWTGRRSGVREVLVLHGPHLGLRIPPGMLDLVEHSSRPTRRTPHKGGLVTGGLMRWGQLKAR